MLMLLNLVPSPVIFVLSNLLCNRDNMQQMVQESADYIQGIRLKATSITLEM
jgi:hypothetical protein